MTRKIKELQLVSALERAQTEVRAGRKLIKEQEASLKSKINLLEQMQKRHDVTMEAVASLEQEVRDLQTAIQNLKDALATRELEVAQLKSDLTKTRRQLAKARTMQKYLAVALGVAVLGFIFGR